MTEKSQRRRGLSWVLIKFGRSVRSRGRRVGSIRQVVINLATRQVTHYTVQRELLWGLLRVGTLSVPSELVQQLEDGRLHLKVSLDEAKRWSPGSLRSATAGALAPATSGDSSQPPTQSQPSVAPRHSPAALSLVRGEPRVRAEAAKAPTPGRIGPGATHGFAVVDPQTEVSYLTRSVGWVDGVVINPGTRQITHFVIRPRQLVPGRRLVPVEGVRKISRRYLYLSMEPGGVALPQAQHLLEDDALTDAVREALAYRGPDGLAQVKVTVLDQEVSLSGVVRSRAARSIAERIAAGVTGVLRVDNRLACDTDIAAEAGAALGRDTRLRRSTIQVTCELGVVSLAGLVATPEESVAAEEVAGSARGVARVDNRLRVGPEEVDSSTPGGLYGVSP